MAFVCVLLLGVVGGNQLVWACLWWGVLGVQVFNFGGEFGAVCLELQLKLGQVAGCR